MFVFTYGSLLSPDSLAATLPGVRLERCVPASCTRARRTFGVAFPNDGSQPDKAYLDEAGRRPPVVLFADLTAGAGQVPGVCLPVTGADLALLRSRELRYDLAEVTGRVTAYPERARPVPGPVLAFVGKPRFTREVDVARGVVPTAYLESVRSGAAFWDRCVPGFGADVEASTDWPPADRVVALRRVDAGHDGG